MVTSGEEETPKILLKGGNVKTFCFKAGMYLRAQNKSLKISLYWEQSVFSEDILVS